MASRTFLLTISDEDPTAVRIATDMLASRVDAVRQAVLIDIEVTEPHPPSCGCGGSHWVCPGPDDEANE